VKAGAKRLAMNTTQRANAGKWRGATSVGTTSRRTTRILRAISCFVLCADANCNASTTNAVQNGNFDFSGGAGGRTRDRTLDLSRVKGTLSR
jgi:hypothetical protein